MYKLTARRLRQIRNAQAISARRRKGRGGRKLSRGHKRVIGVAVAGSVVASGAFGAMYVSKKMVKHHENPAAKPGDKRGKAHYSINQLISEFQQGSDSGSPLSKEIKLKRTTPQDVHVRADAHPMVKSIMHELHGQRVPGGSAKAKYNVIEVTGVQASHDINAARAILASPASQARRERRLDRGLPDYKI